MHKYLVPFKGNPLRYNILTQQFFPILETLLKRAFSFRQRHLFRFSFISSIVAKRFPFIGVFSFGKRKKSDRGPSPVNRVVEA